MKPEESPGLVDPQAEAKNTVSLQTDNNPPGTEDQGAPTISRPTTSASPSVEAERLPPGVGEALSPESEDVPKGASADANEFASSGDNSKGHVIEYRGLRVVVGTTYDLDRKISVGTATGNEIVRAVSVREAVKAMRGDVTRKFLEVAWLAQKEMTARVEEILWQASETGELIVEANDRCFLSGEQNRLSFQAHKDLVSAITAICQDYRLLNKSAWEDESNLAKLRKEISALSWRKSKALHLPGWTFAGVFSLRTIANLLASAGLMPLDFDHVANVLALLAKLKSDPLFFIVAKSPSLTGVKAVVRIPDDAARDPKVYLRCFQAVERYINKHYPEVTLGIDKQAKAVSQLMFYLHDPDAFCREDSYVLLPDEAIEEDAPKQKPTDTGKKRSEPSNTGHKPKKEFAFDKYPPEKQWEVVKSATDALMGNLDKVPSEPGDRNGFWTRLGYAYRDWLKDVEVEGVVNEARQYLLDLAEQHYGGGTQPVQNALDSSGGTCGLGTLFKFAMDYAGWVPPWKSNSETPNDYLKNLHPGLAETYGDPFNFVWKEEREDQPTIWTPVGLNERFFAALLIREGNEHDPAVFDQEENWWFRYHPARGCYLPIKSEVLHETLDRLLLETAKECAMPRINVNPLLFKFRATRSLSPIVAKASGLCAVRSDFWRRPVMTLPVRNGVLDLADKTLTPHSPDWHFRGVIAVDYIPDAACPQWMAFMSKVQSSENVDLIQRVLAHALLGCNLAQVMTILSGEAGSGKGTIIRVVTGIIGPENVGTLRTRELDGRFEMARHRHKLLVYGADVPEDFLSNTGASMIKAMTGEDPISPEYKCSNATPAAEPLTCSVIVTANSRLRLRFQGDKEAWRRRLVLVPFDRSVPEREREAALSARLLDEEGAGILNWLLEGIQKLSADEGRIRLTDEQKRVRDGLLEQSESYVAFAREGVIRDDFDDLTSEEAYDGYVRFCSSRGWAPLTPQVFGTGFKQAVVDLYGITQSHDLIGHNGAHRRGWRGLRLHKSRKGRVFNELE